MQLNTHLMLPFQACYRSNYFSFNWVPSFPYWHTDFEGLIGEQCTPVLQIVLLPANCTFDTLLIRSNSGTFYANVVLLDGFCRINGHLIICLVPVWKPKVIVFAVYVHIGKNQLQAVILSYAANIFISSSINAENNLMRTENIYR